MSQVRPYKSASVKSLEQTFKDYEFNKKVLSSMRAELLLRSTKSARSLLERVDRQLAEIARRDNFSRVPPKPVKKNSAPKDLPSTIGPEIPTVSQTSLIESAPKPVESVSVENPTSDNNDEDISVKETKKDSTEKANWSMVIGVVVILAVIIGLLTIRSLSKSIPSSSTTRQEVKPSPIDTKPKESPASANLADGFRKYHTDKGHTLQEPEERQLPPPTIDDKRIQTYKDTVRNLLH